MSIGLRIMKYKKPVVRIELTAAHLRNECSTTELHRLAIADKPDYTVSRRPCQYFSHEPGTFSAPLHCMTLRMRKATARVPTHPLNHPRLY